jgi:hypothetical protein
MKEAAMTSLDEHVSEIADRIYEVIKLDDTSSILAALIHMIAFEMSLVCPACRECVAKRLAAAVPAMLTEANEIAALIDEDENTQPVCAHAEHHH